MSTPGHPRTRWAYAKHEPGSPKKFSTLVLVTWSPKNILGPLAADPREAGGRGDDRACYSKVFWFTSEKDRGRVGELIVRASEAIIADAEQSRDSAQWLRFGWPDIQRYRDGITIDASVTPASMRAAAKILPPVSKEQGDRFWLKATKEKVGATAAGFGILSVA